MDTTEPLPMLTPIDFGHGSVGLIGIKGEETCEVVEDQLQHLAAGHPVINTGKTFVARDIAEGMMKQAVTIIDVGPTHLGVKNIVLAGELKRRGVRFLPRQALKRLKRSASKAGIINPFASK